MMFHLSHLIECRRMKQSLNEYLGWSGPLTHRQFRMWEEFRMEELNHPERLDYYLMSLTSNVVKANVRNPAQVNASDFQLKFNVPAEISDEERLKNQELYKSIWIARVGGMKALTIKDKDGNVIKAPEIRARKGRPPLPPKESVADSPQPPLASLQRKRRRLGGRS